MKTLRKLTKSVFSFVLAACMLFGVVGIMDVSAETAEPVKYTVTTGGDANFFLSNETPATGKVTLSYTVESATVGSDANNGVVATNAPTATYPYHPTGHMRFNPGTSLLMSVGFSYEIHMELDADGKIVMSGTRSNASGYTESLAELCPMTAGSATPDATYFGIYIAASNTAVLKDVTMVDENGNDLGLQSNKSSCTITKVVEATKYTVTTHGGNNLFLCNATPATGKVTLTYTVESAIVGSDANNGVVATNNPTATYPYHPTGHMQFNPGTALLMSVGFSYEIHMELSEDGKIVMSGTRSNASGYTESLAEVCPLTAGSATPDATYFGIYIAASNTAVLKDVVMIDENGNDLGLQSNQSSCVITKVVPNRPEPKTYTVTTNGDGNFFLCNATPATGKVTMTYTVESATVGSTANNGVIATNAPTTTYPYNGTGHMRFNPGTSMLMSVGWSYEIHMELDADGKIVVTGIRTSASGVTEPLAELMPNSAGAATPDATYFGIFIFANNTAVLKNVTMVDEDGNDLGLQSNKKSCTITDDSVRIYTVDINSNENFFLSNAIPSTGKVTLRYTVKSAVVSEGANNGMIATNAPTSAYPYNGTGHMRFNPGKSLLMSVDFSYEIHMELDADGKIVMSGTRSNTTGYTESLAESCPLTAGSATPDATYFGIYIAPGTTAVLTDVTCVDADGNDLGLQSNQSNCNITTPLGKVEKWNMSLGDDLGVNFYVKPDKDTVTDGCFNVTVGENETVSYKMSEARVDTAGNYIFTIHLAAAQMTDTIAIQMTIGEVKDTVYTYSVLQYANAILEDSSKAAYHNLVKEMLNYGGKAQTYFEHNTNNMADENISVEAAVVPTTIDAQLTVNGSADGISFYGATLLFTSKTAVRYYFTVSGNIDDYTFKLNDTELEPVNKDGLWYVQVSDINPQDLDNVYEIEVTNSTGTINVSYGPMCYIIRMYNGNGSENLKMLLQAMYGYYLAAEALVA